MKKIFLISIISIIVFACVEEDFFGLSPYGEIKSIEVSNQASQAVINAQTKNITVERLSSRVVCNKCGATFNLKTLNNKKFCTICGGNLIRRKDDNASTISTRFENYQKITSPLIKYYEDRNLLMKIEYKKSITVIDLIKSLKHEGILSE